MRYLNFKKETSEEDKKNREKFKKEIEDLTKDLNIPLTKLDDPADSNKSDREKTRINAGAINEYHNFVIQVFNKLSKESKLISKKPESESESESKKIEQKQNNEKTLTLIKNLEKEEKLKTFLDRDENKVKKTALEGALYDLSPACYPQTKIIGSTARSSRKTPIIDGKPSKIQTGYQLVKSETLAKLSKDKNWEFTKTLVKTLKFDENDINNFLTQEENADFSDAEIDIKHLEKAFILAKLKINLDSYSEDEQEFNKCFACFREGKKFSPQSNLSSLIEKKLKAEIESASQVQHYLDNFNNKYTAFIGDKFNKIVEKQDSNEILKFGSTIEYLERTFTYLNGSNLIKRKALEIIFDETTNPEFKKTLITTITFEHKDINDFITSNDDPDSVKRKALEIIFDETTNQEFKKTLENSIIFNHEDIDDFLINSDHDLIRSKTLEIIFDETTNSEFKKTLENSIIFNHEDIDDFLNRKTDTITLPNEKISEKEKLLQLLINRTNSNSNLFALITSPEMNEMLKRNLQPRLGEMSEIQVNNIISTAESDRIPIEISAGPILASFEFAPVAANTTSAEIKLPTKPQFENISQAQQDHDIRESDEILVALRPLTTVSTHQRLHPMEPTNNIKPPAIRQLSEDTPSEPARGA